MKKLFLLAICVVCISSFAYAQQQEMKKDEKIVNVPADVQQSFQLAQADVEKAEANLKAAQAQFDAAKAKREALITRVMLFLRLPFDAVPQLTKDGMLQFLLPPENGEANKPQSVEKKP